MYLSDVLDCIMSKIIAPIGSDQALWYWLFGYVEEQKAQWSGVDYNVCKEERAKNLLLPQHEQARVTNGG